MLGSIALASEVSLLLLVPAFQSAKLKSNVRKIAYVIFLERGPELARGEESNNPEGEVREF
jgi:hypothetical protein